MPILAPIIKRSGLFYDGLNNGRMNERLRLYTAVLQDHLQRHRQMALISGPRQVGKTTTCRSLSDAYFQAQTQAPHAFQVVLNLPYEPADCFAVRQPAVVPARTFLAQLL